MIVREDGDSATLLQDPMDPQGAASGHCASRMHRNIHHHWETNRYPALDLVDGWMVQWLMWISIIGPQPGDSFMDDVEVDRSTPLVLIGYKQLLLVGYTV